MPLGNASEDNEMEMVWLSPVPRTRGGMWVAPPQGELGHHRGQKLLWLLAGQARGQNFPEGS